MSLELKKKKLSKKCYFVFDNNINIHFYIPILSEIQLHYRRFPFHEQKLQKAELLLIYFSTVT